MISKLMNCLLCVGLNLHNMIWLCESAGIRVRHSPPIVYMIENAGGKCSEDERGVQVVALPSAMSIEGMWWRCMTDPRRWSGLIQWSVRLVQGNFNSLIYVVSF